MAVAKAPSSLFIACLFLASCGDDGAADMAIDGGFGDGGSADSGPPDASSIDAAAQRFPERALAARLRSGQRPIPQGVGR